MYDYIKIGSWRSDSVQDLVVMDWDTLLMPTAERPNNPIPGRLTAISPEARGFKPADLTINMAITGNGEADLLQKHRAVAKILWEADHLILSGAPAYHYRGHTAEIKSTEVVDEWLRFRVKFVCNPPCRLRALGPAAGWTPGGELPIPEQITELNASHNIRIDGPKSVTIHDGTAPHAPEVYMMLLGSWDSLNIGGDKGLTIPGLPITSAVWVDCAAQQVYDKVEGVRTTVPNIMGDYETIGRDPVLAFDGVNLDLTAHVLVIERS